ncbi:Uncharacterised protein [Mycobacteroides abscessus subsp. abscessus]|nr:Uncharacterised protein [Mycobacteroides abscessus subsp. abscessus]
MCTSWTTRAERRLSTKHIPVVKTVNHSSAAQVTYSSPGILSRLPSAM